MIFPVIVSFGNINYTIIDGDLLNDINDDDCVPLSTIDRREEQIFI